MPGNRYASQLRSQFKPNWEQQIMLLWELECSAYKIWLRHFTTLFQKCEVFNRSSNATHQPHFECASLIYLTDIRREVVNKYPGFEQYGPGLATGRTAVL